MPLHRAISRGRAMAKSELALNSPPAQAVITYDEYAALRSEVVTSVRDLTIATDDLREAVEKLRAEVTRLTHNAELPVEDASA